MKLILTADLHMGRSSSGLPSSALEHNIMAGTRDAWKRIVDFSIEQEAEAILIAGDMVESASAYYESLGPLLDGFKKLRDKGIEVFAVAGNHDAVAFEKIAGEVVSMEGVHFMGRRGKWERREIIRDGAVRLAIDGWSFPQARYSTNPVEECTLARLEGILSIGMIHGDLGVSQSQYAPLTENSLRSRPNDFWLLGHIHKPNLFKSPNQASILYPGSPQAMDFGETGAHGVWTLDTETMIPEHWQISTVRYENSIELDLTSSEIIDPDLVEQLLLAKCQSQLNELSQKEKQYLRCVIHRCALTGELGYPEIITKLAENLPNLSRPTADSIQIMFDGRLNDLTTIPIDLDLLIERGGAIGLMAKRYHDLQGEAWQQQCWFNEIHKQVLRSHQQCRIEGDDEQIEGKASQLAPTKLTQTKRLIIESRKEVA